MLVGYANWICGSVDVPHEGRTNEHRHICTVIKDKRNNTNDIRS